MRLREELFVLGFDNGGKPAVHPESLDIGVAGARLVELVLAGRVGVSGGRLGVIEALATGDAGTDALLAAIVRATKPPPLAGALSQLRSGAGDAVRADLLAEGVVTKVAQRRLGLVPVTRYPVDETVVRSITVRMWYAAHGRSQPDEPTAALCGLVHAVLLHDHVFTAMPLAGLDQRLREIRAKLSDPVREIVDAVGAMVASAAFAIYR
ncbi:GPP34 family phosphoprotein [Asanoa sp. NPDC049518]|uniref:GOLPH3/VPS74 family protein n=1 Tax=unclassified Asanoa TaxID=2685164 RepID=UPI00342E063C